jgi:hypothetical protein
MIATQTTAPIASGKYSRWLQLALRLRNPESRTRGKYKWQ